MTRRRPPMLLPAAAILCAAAAALGAAAIASSSQQSTGSSHPPASHRVVATPHSAAPSASASQASAAQNPATSGTEPGGWTEITGPSGEPTLKGKCQVIATQNSAPTVRLTLESVDGSGIGVQDETIQFNTGVKYAASSWSPPMSVPPPGQGAAHATSQDIVYPSGKPMPSGTCIPLSYN